MRNELRAKLVSILEQDCRLSNTEIARRLGVSESYGRQMTRRLFDNDEVRRGLLVDFDVMGLEIVAGLRLSVAASQVDNAAEALAEKPCTGLVMIVSGAYNIFAMVVTKDLDELALFFEEEVRRLNGIRDASISIYSDVLRYDSRHAPFRLMQDAPG